MWVGGVADSQTRSKPLKTPPTWPENRLFRPKFHLLFSQISQKPWGRWVGKQIWERYPKKNVFFWQLPSCIHSMLLIKNPEKEKTTIYSCHLQNGAMSLNWNWCLRLSLLMAVQHQKSAHFLTMTMQLTKAKLGRDLRKVVAIKRKLEGGGSQKCFLLPLPMILKNSSIASR